MNYSFITEQLSNLGIKLTNPRKTVIEILLKTDTHMSANEVYLKAVSTNPSIGLTTIYRTLELLTEMGILNKFDFSDDKARYEIAYSEKKEHHHHLICSRCKRIIDYNDFAAEETELMKKTEKKLAGKYGFQIHNHTIHFYGICNKCTTVSNKEEK